MAALAVMATGYGNSGEDTKPESKESQAAANADSAQWSPEMKAKYKQAMAGHVNTTAKASGSGAGNGGK